MKVKMKPAFRWASVNPISGRLLRVYGHGETRASLKCQRSMGVQLVLVKISQVSR